MLQMNPDLVGAARQRPGLDKRKTLFSFKELILGDGRLSVPGHRQFHPDQASLLGPNGLFQHGGSPGEPAEQDGFIGLDHLGSPPRQALGPPFFLECLQVFLFFDHHQ